MWPVAGPGEAPRGHEEYGDPFSIMGNFPRISLYPLKHQLAAGWIKPSQVKEVEESGTYRIVPMETNDDSQLKGLKVKRMTEGAEKPAYLWIEYHQDLGEFHSRPTGSITIRYEDAYLNEKWGDVYTFLPEYFKSNRLRFWEDAFSYLSIEVKAAKRDFADIKVNL